MKISRLLTVCAAVSLVLTLAAVSFMPLGLAQTFGNFGTRITSSGSTDWKPTLYPITANDFVARSERGTAGPTDDAYYLFIAAVHPSTVEPQALRLIPPSGFTFGSFVTSGATDDTSTWGTFTDGTTVPLVESFITGVKYLETDGKPGYSSLDMLYWDAPNLGGCAGNGQLSICDLRLSSGTVNSVTYTAGTIVTALAADLVEAGDADGTYPESLTLTGGFTLWYADLNGNVVPDSGDWLYVRPPTPPTQAGAQIPVVNDLRIASTSATPGTKVGASDSDMVPTLEDANSGSAVAAYQGYDCIVNVRDGGATADLYKVFLHYDAGCAGAPTTIQMGDLVIAGTGLTPGTVVTSTATGYGKTIDDYVDFQSNVFYIDADSSGFYSTSDPVYFNRPSTGTWGGEATVNKVTQYDVRLTTVTAVSCSGCTAGSVVLAASGDLAAYTTLAGVNPGFNLKFFNVDRGAQVPLVALTSAMVSGADGVWTSGTEGVYISADAAVSSGDVRVFDTPTGTAYAAGTVVDCDAPGVDTDCPAGANPAGALVALTNAKVTGPDGTWTPATETVYVSADASVNAPDARVTAVGAFLAASIVANADADAAGSHLDASDRLYLGPVAVGTASIPQRLDLKLMTSFGSFVGTSSSTEFIPTLTNPAAASLNAARYDKGEGGNFNDDVFYLSRSVASPLSAGDVRLLALDAAKAAGTQVASGDFDGNQPVTLNTCGAAGIAACIGFINVAGTANYDAGDIVFLDTNGFAGAPGAAGFSTLDVRLGGYAYGVSTFTAGTMARAGDADVNVLAGTAVAAPPCRAFVVKYWDANGNAVLDGGDTVYVTLDTTAAGGCPGAFTSLIPRLFDIRVSGPGGPTGSSSGGGGATTTPAAVLPTLASGNVNNICISPSGSLTFTVVYTDSQSRAPTTMNLILNSNTHQMTGAGTAYSSGVTYSATIVAPTASGSYAGSFSFANAGGSATIAAPAVTVLSASQVAPTLSGGAVTPSAGAAGSQFTWTVTYTDLNNDAPTVKQVVIDGQAHDMSSGDTTYCNGAVYTYSQTLGDGAHTYAFKFNDATTDVLLPASGTTAGPTVGNAGSASPTASPTPTGATTPTGTPTTGQGGTPGFELVLLLAAAVGVVAIMRRRTQ